MTKERANEIIKQAREKTTCGPWSDQLDKVMTPSERQEIDAVWDTMPGNTAFIHALMRVAKGRA